MRADRRRKVEVQRKIFRAGAAALSLIASWDLPAHVALAQNNASQDTHDIPPVVTRHELQVDAVKHLVIVFQKFFTPENPHNLTHKYYKDWTSADLKYVGAEDLASFRGLFSDEQYSITDAMLPNNMSREDFYRAVMRESARRNLAKGDYTDYLMKKPGQSEQEVNLIRTAYGIPDPVPQVVREKAGVVAIRDAAVDILQNNTPYFRVQSDLAQAVGLKSGVVLPLHTDVRAYDFGYTAGSIPEFRNQNGMQIVASSPLKPAELQAKYCPVMHQLFEEGRSYDNREAFFLGFFQARVDARSNFEPTSEHVGLFASCK